MTAFGGRGTRVDNTVDLHDRLLEAVRDGVPTCINVEIDNVGPAPEMALFH